MDEEEIIPTTMSREKMTVYIISSYSMTRFSYHRFNMKGRRIRMVKIGAYDMPKFKSLDEHSICINTVAFVDQKASKLACYTKEEYFNFDLTDPNKEQQVLPLSGDKILNVFFWRDYQIICRKETPVEVHSPSDGYLQTAIEFKGDYNGGYSAVSRNAELIGRLFLFIGKEGELVAFDMTGLQELFSAAKHTKPKVLSTAKEWHLKGIIPCEILVLRHVNCFSFWRGQLVHSNRSGSVRIMDISHRALDPVKPVPGFDNSKRPWKELIAFAGEELTYLHFSHKNVIGSSFDIKNFQTRLHLFNLTEGKYSSLEIERSTKPVHKIEIFIRNGFKFGIALNRGYDMHVFGIHLCKMYIFQSKVKIASNFISGILFLKDERNTVLIYGDRNYNMKFKIAV